ncbi:TetR/AcrR family transcriptional regulator [Actinocorallia aurea]
MAPRLDREARRRLVSEAAWRVLARDGLAELSVRNVAAEAGLPQSSLRYTFPTVASMREQAAELVIERLGERVARIGGSGPDRARRVLRELLPLDDERRTEMEVYLALGTAAMTDPALRPAHRRVHEGVRRVCADALHDLTAAAPTAPEDPTDSEVSRLHALVDGLALHIVRQDPGTDPHWAADILDTYLDGQTTR